MNKALIRRYFKGEVTAAENEQVKAWIEEQGASWMDTYMEEEWDHPIVQTVQSEKDQMAERVLTAIRERQQAEAPVVAHPARARKKIVRWVAAASLLVIATGVWWQLARQKAGIPAPLSWQMIRNDSTGTVKMWYLPDSSRVTLNAGSFIRVAANYNDTARELQLEGEAFFEVRHDQERPFIVQAGHLVTRVYGTAFNISAYPEASQVRIALKQGKIGISGVMPQEQVLKPGELLWYDKAAGVVHAGRQAIPEIGDWTTGKLTFYKTPLKDVLTSLEKKYGKRFSYPASLHNPTVTASFEQASLRQVLQHLSFVWNVRFEQQNDSIYVR